MTLKEWLQQALSKFELFVESAIILAAEFFYYFLGNAPFWDAPIVMGICVVVAYLYTAGLLIFAGEKALDLLGYWFDYIFDGNFRALENKKRHDAKMLRKEEKFQEEQKENELKNARLEQLLNSERFSERFTGRFEKSPVFAAFISIAALVILMLAMLLLAWAM